MTDNEASNGGAIALVISTARVEDCRLYRNRAIDDGGAVLISGQSPRLSRCELFENSANRGAGIFAATASPTVENCVIRTNIAESEGGGIQLFPANANLKHCTIVGNTAPIGGGIHAPFSSPVITNSIVWGNSIGQIVDGTPVVSHCLVAGGFPGKAVFSADPVLAFPNDSHLMPDSPCRDAGTLDVPGGLPPTDLDGNPRPLDGLPDIGAYEFNAGAPSIALSTTTVHLDPHTALGTPEPVSIEIRNAGGGILNWQISSECDWIDVRPETGTSSGEIDEIVILPKPDLPTSDYSCILPVSADGAVNTPRMIFVDFELLPSAVVTPTGDGDYPTIQAAINAADDGHLIYLTDGVYRGPGNKNLSFKGKAITVRSLNGPDACIIDCEHDGFGVWFNSGEGAGTVLQGVRIINATEHGILIGTSGEILIRDCVVENCTGLTNGGGVLCLGGAPILERCRIVGNYIHGYGGGISFRNAADKPARMIDCEITDNVSTSLVAGGVHTRYGWLEMDRCLIARNQSAVDGGGIGAEAPGSFTMNHCRIIDNSCSQDGGGLCLSVS
jgi:hypothetical protein